MQVFVRSLFALCVLPLAVAAAPEDGLSHAETKAVRKKAETRAASEKAKAKVDKADSQSKPHKSAAKAAQGGADGVNQNVCDMPNPPSFCSK